MPEDYEVWYLQQFRDTLDEPLGKSDGLSDEKIDTLLEGREIPAAMRAYYRVAGDHWLNTNHNELRTLDALETIDDYTCFMDENQMVVQWAIRNEDMVSDDPLVYQGIETENGYQWHSVDMTFSQFMMAMWKWVLTGEL